MTWTHFGELRGGEVAEAEFLAQVFLNAKGETAAGPIPASQEAEQSQEKVIVPPSANASLVKTKESGII